MNEKERVALMKRKYNESGLHWPEDLGYLVAEQQAGVSGYGELRFSSENKAFGFDFGCIGYTLFVPVCSKEEFFQKYSQ